MGVLLFWNTRTREPEGFLAGVLLAVARSHSRENSYQLLSYTLAPLRYPYPPYINKKAFLLKRIMSLVKKMLEKHF